MLHLHKDRDNSMHRMLTGKLTHCGQVTPYGDVDMGQHWLRQWLVAAIWSETMLPLYPLAFKPGWYFLDRKIKNRVYVGNGSTKYPRQLKNYSRGGVKNKTNWKTYVVIQTKRYYQCIFDRIRKLFSGDVIPLCLLEICTFEITASSPRGQLLATRNPSRSHCQSLPESMFWHSSMLPLGHNRLN